MKQAIGSVNGIGAPLQKDRIGGDTWPRYIGDRLVFDMHEGAGMTLRDLSGNGNAGAFGAGVEAPIWERNRLNFNVPPYVDCGSLASIDELFDSGAILEVMLNPNSAGEGDFGRILDKAAFVLSLVNPAATNCFLHFKHSFTTQSGEWHSTSRVITFLTSQHIVLVYNNSDVTNDPTLYRDTMNIPLTESRLPTGVRISDATHKLYVGNRADKTRGFDGLIFFIRINATVFSAPQVLQKYLWNKWRN